MSQCCDQCYGTGYSVGGGPCPQCSDDQYGVVNLTPHGVVIIGEDNSVLATIPPSGTVARCATTREVVGSIQVGNRDVPVNRTRFGAVDGLPAPQDGTSYIVSSIVAQACRGRQDLIVPDDTVRDAEGRIVGCRAFARL